MCSIGFRKNISCLCPGLKERVPPVISTHEVFPTAICITPEGLQLQYNPTVSICCGGQLYSKKYYDCCGPVAYRKDFNFCCGGYVYPLKSYDCCDGRGYNTFTQVCCEGKIWPKKKGYVCCGTRIYPLTKFFHCCNGHPCSRMPEPQ